MDATFSIFIIRVYFVLDFSVQNFNIQNFKFEKNIKNMTVLRLQYLALEKRYRGFIARQKLDEKDFKIYLGRKLL